jgi:GNAT superfamily N-acetyltransferase
VHTRFFSYMDPELLRRAASIGSGTVCVVALDSDRVVGEARYAPSDGTHELAVTVADDAQSRGLGTLLLQRLRGEARSRGLSSLRAVVQVDNRAMLRVLEKAGLAVVCPSDGDQVTVDVGTDAYMPDWGLPTRRARVLVEARGLGDSLVARQVRGAGFDVRQCPGPRPSGVTRCPLVGLGRCRLVEQADAVVHLLPPEDEECAAVSRALGTGRPGQVLARSAEEWLEAAPHLVAAR